MFCWGTEVVMLIYVFDLPGGKSFSGWYPQFFIKLVSTIEVKFDKNSSNIGVIYKMEVITDLLFLEIT